MVTKTCDSELNRNVLRSSKLLNYPDIEIGDTYEVEEITVHYACGRIDIRDDSKKGYDGWDEYGVAPMHGEDWNALGDFLWDLETDVQLSYEQLIERFELWYGKQIRWIK
jgi:hypothetical protein